MIAVPGPGRFEKGEQSAMPTILLAEFLPRDLVLWNLAAADKPALLAELAHQVAEGVDRLDAADLLERLEQREAEGSTGVGIGLALPHAMMPQIEQTVLALCRVAGNGVEYGAADGQRVDLVLLVLSPEQAQARHLRVLGEAGLVRVEKQGRERFYRLDTRQLSNVAGGWIRHLSRKRR